MKGKAIPGIFEGIENNMLFKNQRNSWNFSFQKRTNSENFGKKNHNIMCGNPFLQNSRDFCNCAFLQLKMELKMRCPQIR